MGFLIDFHHDVPVADAVSVQIVERIESLSHDKCSLGLGQMFTLSDEEEKFSAFAQSKKKRGVKNKWNQSLKRSAYNLSWRFKL